MMKIVRSMMLVTIVNIPPMPLVAMPSPNGRPNTDTGRTVTTNDSAELIDLFDRWEKVWHEERYDLIPGCVGDHYIRPDQQGDRTVTRAEYVAEIKQVHQGRPGIRVVVYDHALIGDRAWFRFAFKWTDPKTGEPRSMAGFQSYRVEGGKLVETWLSMQPLGSVWPDKAAQRHWTDPAPGK